MKDTQFEWDENKNISNKEKHHVSFEKAQYAFMDTKRIIAEDIEHSSEEKKIFLLWRCGWWYIDREIYL